MSETIDADYELDPLTMSKTCAQFPLFPTELQEIIFGFAIDTAYYNSRRMIGSKCQWPIHDHNSNLLDCRKNDFDCVLGEEICRETVRS